MNPRIKSRMKSRFGILILSVFLAACSVLHAQVSPLGTPMPWIKPTFIDNNGRPAAGYCLYSYTAGTTNAIATYTTPAMGTSNNNPTSLDSAGRASIYLDPARAYKFVLGSKVSGACPTNPSAVWTVDNVTDPASLFNAAFTTLSGSLSTLSDSLSTFESNLASNASSKGDTLVGHYAPGTGGAGRTVNASLKDLVFNVKDYGAKGDNSVDDGTAIYNASVALSANGGGTLLIPPGTYKVWTVGQTYPFTSCNGLAERVIMPFCGLTGVKIIGEGATIAMDPTNTDMDASQLYATYIFFGSCINTEVNGLKVTGPPVSDYTRSNYPVFVYSYKSNGISMVNNWVQGVEAGFLCQSNVGDSVASHDRNIHIVNLTVVQSYYGVNSENSGDNEVIDNLVVDTADRALFNYGNKNVKAQLIARNIGATIVLLYGGYYQDLSLENYDVTVLEGGFLGPNTTTNAYNPIEITHGTVHPAIIRNVKIRVELNPNPALSGQACAILLSKLAGAYDNGDIMDGIDISGSINGVVVGSPFFYGVIAMPTVDTWGAGDHWYNINLHDLNINSGHTPAIESNLNLGSLGSSSMSITNVTSDGNINLTNIPADAHINIVGSSIPNYLYEVHDRWETISATVAFDSGAPLAPGASAYYTISVPGAATGDVFAGLTTPITSGVIPSFVVGTDSVILTVFNNTLSSWAETIVGTIYVKHRI